LRTVKVKYFYGEINDLHLTGLECIKKQIHRTKAKNINDIVLFASTFRNN
jgi:hypothetical protein